MLACGIGCRRGTPADDIEAAIRDARTALGCADEIAVIATEASKLHEPGLREAARRLGVVLVAYSAAELRSAADAVLTASHAALLHKDTPSVAEAAALLAGGANARLLGPRLANPTTTCAFAVGDGALP
ncbi:cobalamin biosynthesis protein [Hyphomicrobium sp.]|uniref:cobalamin biosynthesis protein n=1 Tax=Hyphomicrobium sp. TaxID=82 RepID=UPI0025BB71E5|nr:cobalamin biosynthesis protein [Hyphomicrobium sp.]MCC7252906.1 cobalamin biosynthesis protein [Hyphomicrobium sp.]